MPPRAKNRCKRHFALNLGNYGAASMSTALYEERGRPRGASTVLAYDPPIARGSLSFRIRHAEQEQTELEFGVRFGFTLRNDVSAQTDLSSNNGRQSLGLSAQRAPASTGGFGWRARAVQGDRERLDAAVQHVGVAGDTIAQASSVRGAVNARIGHAGSIGFVSSAAFAGQPIEGAFALVDTGAPGVSVSRNSLEIGRSGRRGRVLVQNLQPYQSNTIRIDAEDLPVNLAPETDAMEIALADRTGARLAFSAQAAAFTETNVRFADGATPPRGAVLTRARWRAFSG